MRRVPKTTPSTFAPTARRYSSSVSESMSLFPVAIPAFRNAKSTAPTPSHTAASPTSNPVARSSDCTSHPCDSSSATVAAPMPDAPPVTTALRNKDDLPDVTPVLDQPVRCGRLRQRELGPDNRPYGARLPQPDQLLGRRGNDLRSQSHQPAEVEPGDAHVAADDERRVQIRPHSSGVADGDHGPERVERLQGRREHLPADRIEDDVR